MRFWLLGLVMIVLIGCGESSDTPDEPPTEAEATPTEASIGTPPSTPTSEPLTQGEEQAESDFFEDSFGFGEVQYDSAAKAAENYKKNRSQVTGDERPNIVTKGLFQISVIRGGPFTVSGKDSSDEQYYRLDLRIENIGDESGIFEPEGMLLTDQQGNEFGLHLYASKRVLNWPFLITPDSVERGYVLFDPLPEAVGSIRITFNLRADYFQYDLDLEAE